MVLLGVTFFACIIALVRINNYPSKHKFLEGHVSKVTYCLVAAVFGSLFGGVWVFYNPSGFKPNAISASSEI